MNTRLHNDKGVALLSLVALTAMIPVVILLLLSLNSSQASHARYFNSADTLLRMKEIKNYLMYHAKDIDNDGKYEPPAAINNALFDNMSTPRLPVVPYNTKDAWKNDYIYCAWDLGSANTVDNTYSQNNIAPPGSADVNTAVLTGRIVSLGANGTFDGLLGELPCTATEPRGDDIFVEFTQAEIGNIAGWIKDGKTVNLITNSDTVQVGQNASFPPDASIKLDVQGGVLRATDGFVIEPNAGDPASPKLGQIWVSNDRIRYMTISGARTVPK
jgi:hypothetical protein